MVAVAAAAALALAVLLAAPLGTAGSAAL